MMAAKHLPPATLKLVRPDGRTSGGRKVVRYGKQHKPVVRALAPGGLTDEELAIRGNLTPSHARGRRSELVRLGFVEDTGTTRKTTTGRNAAVWRLTTAGRRKANQLRNTDG